MSARLEVVGSFAIEEHVAWKDRNAKRLAYRTFLKNYLNDTGEWYESGGEPEVDDAHDSLKYAAKAAQRALTAARAATRRAIARIGCAE